MQLHTRVTRKKTRANTETQPNSCAPIYLMWFTRTPGEMWSTPAEVHHRHDNAEEGREEMSPGETLCWQVRERPLRGGAGGILTTPKDRNLCVFVIERLPLRRLLENVTASPTQVCSLSQADHPPTTRLLLPPLPFLSFPRPEYIERRSPRVCNTYQSGEGDT